MTNLKTFEEIEPGTEFMLGKNKFGKLIETVELNFKLPSYSTKNAIWLSETPEGERFYLCYFDERSKTKEFVQL